MSIDVNGAFRLRWMLRQYVGDSRPIAKCYVRRGSLVRSHRSWDGDQFGNILGAAGALPWVADWTPHEPYQEVNVVDFRLEDSFDNNGITSATITIDNQILEPHVGPGGLYHEVATGYFSPLRGWANPGQPTPPQAPNSWFGRLLYKAQVTLEVGYGNVRYKVFTGLLDTIQAADKPHQLKMICRDFGQILVEQNFYSQAIDPRLTPPVIFMPGGGKSGADATDNTEKVGGAATASSTNDEGGHKPRFIVDTDGNTYWQSNLHNGPNVTEWVQFHVPAGRYGSIYVLPKYEGMECFVGVYMRPPGAKDLKYPYFNPRGTSDNAPIPDSDIQIDTYKHKKDGTPVPVGWWNPHGDIVPGEHGGWAYFKHYASLPAVGKTVDFGGDLTIGEDTVFRIGFRNLGRIRQKGDDKWAAGVTRAFGIKRKQKSADEVQGGIGGLDKGSYHIVLIDDVMDIARVLFRWAGFKDWDVQNAGVNIKRRYTVGQDKKFRDVIQDIQNDTGFVYFMQEPVQADDLSIGVPTLRQPGYIRQSAQVRERVSSEALLEGLQTSYTDEPLRTMIEIWGGRQGSNKAAKGKQGGKGVAKKTKSSKTKSSSHSATNKGPKPKDPTTSQKPKKAEGRQYAKYLPPWRKRLAGVKKYFSHLDDKLETDEDCMVLAFLIAVQMALAAYTGTFQTPGTPGFGLDDLVSIVDKPAGLDSRVYVSNRVMTFKTGDQTEWKTEFGGALTDTPDILYTAVDYWNWVVKNAKAKVGGQNDKDRGVKPVH